MARVMLTIPLGIGQNVTGKLEVRAYETGVAGLVAHHTLTEGSEPREDARLGWTLTHQRSGKKLIASLAQLRWAKGAALRLAGFNWDREAAEIPHAELAAAYAIVTAIREELRS